MPTGPGLYFSSCDGVAVGARILSRPVPRQQIAEHALPVASADAASIRWMAPAGRNAAPHGQPEIIATEPGICRRRDTAQTTACWHDGLHGNAICRLLRHAVHGRGAAVTRRVQLSLANQDVRGFASWHQSCSGFAHEPRRGVREDGPWRLYPHRQQRLADLDRIPAIQAKLRSQPRGGAESRALRVRIRAVDDQAARLRRQERVLGLQPRIVHIDGRARRSDQQDPALRLDRRAHAAAGARRPHGGHHRLDLARPVRHQHRVRLGQGRIRADGPVAR